MHSKNKPAPTKAEKAHADRLASMACVVCGSPGPSTVHHIKQRSFWYCVPLCQDCHQGPMLGIHGQKRAWTLAKMDETDALAATIERLNG
ncbi:MAG: hypothetical protein KAZ23_01490 [Burkholderiaceae bacterium]|nr:hypothetical protein [Burkholderiaceae bacterium]